MRFWDWAKSAWILVLAAYGLGVVFYIASRLDSLQWDFRTYYYAGVAFEEGLNPYLIHPLSQAAGQEIALPFAYPPFTLLFFSLLNLLPYETAAILFLGAKALAMVALFWIWQRFFLKGPVSPLFYIFCASAFSGALYADLVSGNISTFEQLFIWSGFLALIRGRPGLFAALIVLAGLFKVLPIGFLTLLFFWPIAGRLKASILALTTYASIHLASALAQPGLYRSWSCWLLAGGLDERGSNLALFRDIVGALQRRGLSLPDVLPWIAYLAVVGLVLWFAFKVVQKHGFADQRMILFVIVIAFALVAPRFKDYSYILLLGPAYALITRYLAPETGLVVLIPMLSAELPLPFGLSGSVSTMFWAYYPLLVTWLLGLLVTWRLDAKREPGHRIRMAEGEG